MNDGPQEATEVNEPTPPTQAQLYDDLRCIGQLEDQKYAIQTEIDERTGRLRHAIPTLDRGSLLYKLLSASMKQPVAKKAKANPRSTKKKTINRRGS